MITNGNHIWRNLRGKMRSHERVFNLLGPCSEKQNNFYIQISQFDFSSDKHETESLSFVADIFLTPVFFISCLFAIYYFNILAISLQLRHSNNATCKILLVPQSMTISFEYRFFCMTEPNDKIAHCTFWIRRV